MNELEVIKESENIIENENISFEFNRCRNDLDFAKAKKVARLLHPGWPDASSFWDMEAEDWASLIEPDVKKFIKGKLNLNGSILELGSGSYPYLKNSICLDISKEMLHKNPNKYKIRADIEQGLPFRDKKFDNIVLCFVMNYVKDVHVVYKEINRVLKKNGTVYVFGTKKVISKWHRNMEKNRNYFKKMKNYFNVEFFKFDNLHYAIGKKI